MTDYNTSGKLDLENYRHSTFPDGLEISNVVDDILLVEIQDLDGGDYIKRDGIFLNATMQTSAWRVGKVLFFGPKVSETSKKCIEEGKSVIFPNDKGIGAELKFGSGKKKVFFISESRIFAFATVI